MSSDQRRGVARRRSVFPNFVIPWRQLMMDPTQALEAQETGRRSWMWRHRHLLAGAMLGLGGGLVWSYCLTCAGSL